ncbi:hypothetical protein ACOMHN_042135 [Nucella lapillus]
MTLPVQIRVALGLAGFSMILFLAGFASNFWFTSERVSGSHFGLWAICTSSGCYSYGTLISHIPAHAYVGRFCTIYELIASVIGLILLCLFAFKSQRPNWARSGYSTLLSGGIVGFLGAAIFLGREKSLDTTGTVNVSWSGILVIFAAIIQIVSSVLIILPIRRGQVEFEQA